MRLIDADALWEEVDNLSIPDGAYNYYSDIFQAFDDAPTIEAEPVRHGHWTQKKSGKGIWDYYFICSECHKNTPDKAFPIAPDYCPNCGAKMDGTVGGRL